MLKLPRTKCSLTRIFMLLLVLFGVSGPFPVGADNPVSVLVLPFNTHATENLDYLRTEIATVLGEHLASEGATIIELEKKDFDAALKTDTDINGLREMGRRYGADQIMWGSFTHIGDSFSMDARLAKSTDDTAPMAFNVQGRGLENLLKVLKELSNQIRLKLFQQELVAEIRIQGNQRIEADAIQRVIKTKVGGIYQKSFLSKDLHAIFSMGYFDDLRAEAESGPNGPIITFHVKEKPTVRRVRIKGNLRFDDDEIKENLTISTGAILNIFKVRSNIEQIEAMYKDKNYHQIKVDYKVLPLDNNQADLEFVVEEGSKLYVTTLEFEGNKAFTDKKLNKIIKTSTKGFFFFITSSGDLDRAKLDQDAALLNAFYHNHGYIHARVGEPQVDITEKGIHITFKVEEGLQYKIGKVDISGDLILPKKELIKDLGIGNEAYYSRERVRNDVIALTDLYGNHGYAYADVDPIIRPDHENKVVDITYTVKKKQEVYFENIMISGNTRTRDKVIRRELRIHEKERFNGKALKRSIRNIYRMDYFEDVKVNTLKGSADDQMALKIDVTEKPTGMFTFGAGYSSEENLFLVGSISQRNFLGNGQTLQFSGQLGGSTTRFSLSFTEPWLFDMPLSATVRAYNQEKEYEDEYDVRSKGGGLGFSYPIFDFTRLYWSYGYDISDVTNVTDQADDTIVELEGTNVTSDISLALGYDSRDSALNPSEGSKHKISFEYAGVGGDVGFNKYFAETGWYFPLFKGLVGFVHGKAGYVKKNDDDKLLPDYEKFYLGGMNSLRGFDYRGVHLTNEKLVSIEDGTPTVIETKVGGEKMVQFNIELIIPLYKTVVLMGVFCYNADDVVSVDIEWSDLSRTAGYGIRWFSPMAPIRIEYGKILDRREGEDSGRWEFTMGGAF